MKQGWIKYEKKGVCVYLLFFSVAFLVSFLTGSAKKRGGVGGGIKFRGNAIEIRELSRKGGREYGGGGGGGGS